MLSSLSWLETGQTFPPPSEKERLERYAINEQLFLTQHPKVWGDVFQRLAKRYGKSNWDVETILNYHQLLSKKTADFVCGEPPIIETEGDTDKLTNILDEQDFFAKLYESTIDVSRYANAVLKLRGTGLSLVPPKYWFPVVSPDDLKVVVYDVIAFLRGADAKGRPNELYAEIHSADGVETRVHSYDAEKREIGPQRFEPTTVSNNGIKTIYVLSNITHSGSVYGLDDYEVINSIVAKIMWRLHCADTVLDRHSDPSMSGPESALSYDERTGMWYVPLGNYFKRGTNEEPDLKYITWDGNLEAAWKEIELLLKQLYIITEFGQAFAEGGGGGDAASGTALKLRMVSPRIKAQRLVGINAGRVKRLITAIAKLNNIDIKAPSLTIHWKDGLPIDEVEQINTLTTATGKPVMSQYAAMKARGLSDAQVEAEMEQLRKEQAAAGPLVLSTLDLNNPPPK